MVMVLVHLLQLPDTFGHAAHEFRCCEHQTSRRSDQLRPGNAARLTGVSQSQQDARTPAGQGRGQQPATRQTRTGQRQRCAAEPIPARSAQEEGFAYRVSFLPSPEWEQKRSRDAKEEDAPRLFSGCFSGVPGSAAAPEAGGSTLTRSSRVSSARCACTTQLKHQGGFPP